MSREILAILLIAATTTVAAAFVGLRSGGDDKPDGLFVEQHYAFGTPGPEPTLTTLEQQEEELKSLATTATYKVSYETRDGDGRITSTKTVYQLAERFHREDVGINTTLSQTFVQGDVGYVCDSHDMTCLTREDATAAPKGGLLSLDVINGVRPAMGNIYYRCYQTTDGFIAVAALVTTLHRKFLAVTGIEDWRGGIKPSDIDYTDPKILQLQGPYRQCGGAVPDEAVGGVAATARRRRRARGAVAVHGGAARRPAGPREQLHRRGGPPADGPGDDGRPDDPDERDAALDPGPFADSGAAHGRCAA